MCYETTLVTCRKMKMITFCAFLCAFMRYDNLKLVKYILENKFISYTVIFIK